MAGKGRLTVDQKVKDVLFYAETKSVVLSQRCFRAHFGTRWAPCKQTIYRLSLGTIFQSTYQMSNAFVKIKMCYVYNQWYDISCAKLYIIYCSPVHIQFPATGQEISKSLKGNYFSKETSDRRLTRISTFPNFDCP